MLLQSRVMRTLGLTSYSIYLWHMPVLWVIWWTLDELPGWQRVVCALAALVPVVAASFYFLERPWLRAAHPRGRERESLRLAVTAD
jgi:peptidoglycan/LPS O-acetylase OafA/YrhL